MTLTHVNTLNEYQRSPRGAPDGVTSNPLARVTGTNGTITIGSETERRRLNSPTNAFLPAANYLDRLLTLSNTPPAAGGAGTRKFDNWTFRISAVDAAGGWVELEGCRFEDAGTSVSYTVHAACDFSAASASFPADEAPAATRTVAGPSTYKSLYIIDAINEELNRIGWTISGRTSATAVRISAPFPDILGTFPAETGLVWSLRDAPVYTQEQLFKRLFQCLITTGWTVWQFRGRNNGVGASPYIVHDVVFRSTGEDGRKVQYLRMTAFNPGDLNGGSDGSGFHGIDMAWWSAWDRSFVNAAGHNPGNGVNPCKDTTGTTVNGQWAAMADPTGNANVELGICPAVTRGSALSLYAPWASPNHTSAALRFSRPNEKHTPEGGETNEIDLVYLGDLDGGVIYLSAEGYGKNFVGFGNLEPRSGGQETIMHTNDSVANGVSVEIRVGGAPGNPTSNGIDPQNPPSGPAYMVGDNIQIVGQTVNPGVTPGTSDSGERIESTTISSFPGLRPARGSITVVPTAQLVAGQVVVIDDNEGNVDTFEFRPAGGAPSGGNIAVDLTGLTTADQVRDAFIAAHTGSGTTNITLSVGGSALVSAVHGTAGGVGNVAITHTVTDPGFAVVGMRGGGYSIVLTNLNGSYAAGALVGEEPQAQYFLRFAHIVNQFTADGGFILSNRANNADATYRDHNGPGAAGCGFLAQARPGPLDIFREVNPNRRTGRHGMVPLTAVDVGGGQVRGNARYVRVTVGRLAAYRYTRDPNNEVWFGLPFLNTSNATTSTGAEITANPYAVRIMIGPMPRGMIGL